MIYVGPFSGEIGYELLYWIPNVYHKFRDKLDQVTAISRGKTDSWYPCKVINFYDVMPPEEYRERYIARKKTTGEYKQLWPDDAIDRDIMARLGIEETAYHPSNFYNKLGHGIGTARPFYPIAKGERYPGLPEDYLAIRFYENDFMVNVKPDFRNSTAKLVALVPENPIDNHKEIKISDCDHVVKYGAHDSLDVITRVIAHSNGYIGTYGGLSYIAPLCGVSARAIGRGWAPNKHTPAEDRLGPLFKREIVE